MRTTLMLKNSLLQPQFNEKYRKRTLTCKRENKRVDRLLAAECWQLVNMRKTILHERSR